MDFQNLLFLALVYLVIGCAFVWLPLYRLRNSKIIPVVMLASIAFPIAIDPTPRNLIQSGILLIVLGIEFVFAYKSVSFTHPENLQNVAYVSLKRSAAVLVSVFAVEIVSKWPSPMWALKNNGIPVWVQAVVAFFVLDLYLYVYHRAQHGFAFWWRFHRLHHAPTEMTTLVAGRIHLVEWCFKQILGPVGLTFLFGFSTDAYLYGYVVPVLILDSLSHANLDFPRTRGRWLSYIFALPNVHAIHHTPDRDRVNYGVMLTLWDLVFKTFEMPKERVKVFGIENDSINQHGLWRQHIDAFKKES